MKGKYLWLSLTLTALAVCVSLALFSRLPEYMPSHWNIQGRVDGYAPRSLGAFLMPGIMAGIVVLGWFLKWMSPRTFEVDRFSETYSYVLFCIVALMAYMHGLMLAGAIGNVAVDRWLVGGALIVFALMGNVMGRIRRNFWMGVRTPWTLASDQVWNDTHRFAGRIYVAMAVLGLILLAAGASMVLLFMIIIVGSLIPVPYSLYLAKKDEGPGKTGTMVVWGVVSVVVILAICAGVYAIVPKRTTPSPELSAKAVFLLDNLAAGRPAPSERDFAPVMRSALPPGKLSAFWDDLQGTLGTYRSRTDISGEDKGSYRIVYITMRFEKGDRELKVVFDRRGEVSGLWVTN